MRLLLLPCWIFLCLPVCAQAPVPEIRSHRGAAGAATLVSYPGSNTIQALAVDASGNIFVAGTTASADFPVVNAAQSAMGEARIRAALDGGATWTNVGNPPADIFSLATSLLAPEMLLTTSTSGIYKSSDRGRTWRTVYQSNPSRASVRS